MKLSVILLVTATLATITLLFVACRPAPTYVEGGIYSVKADEGGYGVVKVLKVDDGGVHVRVYSNLFPARPRDLDTAKLYMAGMDHKPTEQLGMGHTPVSHASFRTWGAELIKRQAVKEDELDGYRMWKDAKGGYF